MAIAHHKFFRLRHVVPALLAIALTAGLHDCLSRSVTQQQADAMHMPGDGFAIYAAGDIADGRNFVPADTDAAKTAALVLSELGKSRDAAVLTLGDNTYPVGLPIEFNNCCDPTWGQFKARTYPSPGNHDDYTPAGIGYYGYFGAAAGPERRGYFSVELDPWHVVSLNSNLKNDAARKQLKWLKTDLAQHQTRCTLAYWHHPMYSSGGHGNNPFMKDIWQMLSDAGADVVRASHDHDYERFAPQNGMGKRDGERGIRQFVVGTGGAKLTLIGFRKSNSEISDNSSHGVLKMVLKESGYQWDLAGGGEYV